MKHNLTRVIGALLFITISFTSCKKEEIAAPDKKITFREDPACCVASLPSAPEVVYTNATFGITVTAYNDANTTYVTISRAAGNMTIRYANPGICPTQTTMGTLCDGCTTHSLSFANPTGWECGDPVTFSFYLNGLGGGSNNTLQTCVITYNLKDVCGCPYVENTFTGTSTTTCGSNIHSATYSLCSQNGIASFHIQGGLTNFTGANATVAFVEGTGTVSQHTPGNSSNRIVEVDGSVGVCACVTFNVTWNSTNTNGEVTGGWSAVGFGGDLFVPALNCNNP